MPQPRRSLLFVGIKSTVVALDAASGSQVWLAELRTSDFVNVLWDGGALYAANSGEVWRLDPASGAEIWHNKLSGLGRGLVSLASTESSNGAGGIEAVAEKRRRDAASAAAAAT